MPGFIFGKRNLPATPDELARRRSLLNAIKARMSGRVPQDPWEGLNSIAQALGQRYEESRLNEAEAAGRASGNASYAPFAKRRFCG